MTGIKDVGAVATAASEPPLWRPGGVMAAAICVLAFEYAARLATTHMLSGTTDPALWQGGWEISMLLTLTALLVVFPLLTRRTGAGLLCSFALYPGSANGMLLAAALPFTYILPSLAAILCFFPESRSAPGDNLRRLQRMWRPVKYVVERGGWVSFALIAVAAWQVAASGAAPALAEVSQSNQCWSEAVLGHKSGGGGDSWLLHRASPRWWTNSSRTAKMRS